MSTIGRKLAKRVVSRKKPRRHSGTFTLRLAGPPPTTSGEWGIGSRSQYQRRVCELELQVSQLKAELEELRSKAASSEWCNNYYANVFKEAPAGFVTLDELGKIIEFNQAFSEMVGAAEVSPVKLFFSRFLPPGYLAPFMEHLLEARRFHWPVSCELWLRARGKTIPVELISRGQNLKNMQRAGLTRTIVVDCTNRLKAEEARAKRQSDFRLLVETIQGVVWEVDAHTLEITYISARAEQMLGYSPAYWSQGVTWESHVYHEDRERLATTMRRLATDGKDTSIEYRMLRADRRVVWVHNSMSAATIGRSSRLFGVVIDITDRKVAEEELRNAREQLEQRVSERTAQLRRTVNDLEAFSYSLSHDLRAPLRAMQGYAQLLLNRLGPELDDTGRTYFHRLIKSTERLDHLIQDVLRYSQVARAPVDLKPIDLERLLSDVVNDYPALLPPRMRIDVQKPLLAVRAHEAFLTQCLSNLISNAAKFNRPGQTPCVKISTQELKRGKVRVWFEDNGIGIAPEDQRRIFGIFERVHSNQDYEGTGIGLAIVAKAVERMGGHVGVESAVGHGSRFWLDLHAAQQTSGLP